MLNNIEASVSLITPKVYIVILCILMVYTIYLYLYYSFDSDLKKRNEKLAIDLTDNKLEALVNGSGINNIPHLNIVTTNPGVQKASSCAEGPVQLGTFGTDDDCIRTCANDSASVVNVGKNDSYVYHGTKLPVGAHCILGPRPQCNMRTTLAMMTINSVVCHPKYPELIGGPNGNKVVACNNDQINDPQNILWDYRENKRVNPFTDNIMDVDELLPATNKFRYRCRFNGFDEQQNKYMEHPNNRFHPFRNYCASQIYAAHTSIQPVFDANSGSYNCFCGDPNVTRVKNIDPYTPSTICADVQQNIRGDVKNRKIITVPYRCFTLFSPVTDVGRYLPCPNDQLTRRGSQFSSVDVPFSQIQTDAVEHPLYKDFGDVGIGIGKLAPAVPPT